MAGGAGDWPCPDVSCVNHTKLVFGSKAQCPKCGAARDGPPPVSDNMYSMPFSPQSTEQFQTMKGMQGGDSTEDWQCPNTGCINHTKMVFGRKASCPKCGTARNAKQPGDWQCPNPNCLNHTNTVFARNPQCPKCGAPRMGSCAPQILQMIQPFMGDKGKGKGFFNPMAGGGGHGSNPGDWQCPNSSCINNSKMVFGKHESCPKCGTAKMPAFGGKGGKGGKGSDNPGDWQCPNTDCLNHRNKVFAKHTTCPQCGQDRPGDFGARQGRSRSPYRML